MTLHTVKQIYPADGSWRKVRCSDSHNVAIDSRGKVHCWGDDYSSQCQSPEWLNSYKVSTISCGFAHSVALTSDGRLASWGRNHDGQLPDVAYDYPVRSACAFANNTCVVNAYGDIDMHGIKDRHYSTDELRGYKAQWAVSSLHHLFIKLENNRFVVLGHPRVTRTNIRMEIAKAMPVKMSAGTHDAASISESGEVFIFQLTRSFAHFRKIIVPGIFKDIEMNGNTLMTLDEHGFVDIHGSDKEKIIQMPWDIKEEAWVDLFMKHGIFVENILPDFIRKMDGYEEVIKMQMLVEGGN